MSAVTPIYGIPYELLNDQPDGATLGEAGFLAVEAELARIDATEVDDRADLDAVIAQSASIAPIATAWTDWTVAWASTGTQPAVGNATISGRYKTVGKLCFFFFSITMGSTTTYGTGTYSFSFPPGVTSFAGASSVAFGFRDTSAATHTVGWSVYNSGSTAMDARPVGGNLAGPTTPYTFAANDIIRAWGWVELA